MTHYNFFLTALFSLMFAVWVNLNYSIDDVIFWTLLISCPFIIMISILTITKTITLFRK